MDGWESGQAIPSTATATESNASPIPTLVTAPTLSTALEQLEAMVETIPVAVNLAQLGAAALGEAPQLAHQWWTDAARTKHNEAQALLPLEVTWGSWNPETSVLPQGLRTEGLVEAQLALTESLSPASSTSLTHTARELAQAYTQYQNGVQPQWEHLDNAHQVLSATHDKLSGRELSLWSTEPREALEDTPLPMQQRTCLLALATTYSIMRQAGLV